MPVIYLDVLFGVNYLINFSLLMATGIISSQKIVWWRTLLGAFVGTLYCLVILFPKLLFMQVLFIKILVSFLMVWISYRGNIKSILKLLGLFYIVSFAFAGIVLGTVFLQGGQIVQQNGIFYFKLPFVLLLCSMFIGGILLFRVGRAIIQKRSLKDLYATVLIGCSGKHVVLSGFIDTGNGLTEPLSGLPVMIASKKSLEPLFGREKLNRLICLNDDTLKLFLLPCSTVADSGMITAFMPDSLSINGVEKRGLVGIYDGQLAGDYEVLINPQFVSMEVHDEALC